MKRVCFRLTAVLAVTSVFLFTQGATAKNSDDVRSLCAEAANSDFMGDNQDAPWLFYTATDDQRVAWAERDDFTQFTAPWIFLQAFYAPLANSALEVQTHTAMRFAGGDPLALLQKTAAAVAPYSDAYLDRASNDFQLLVNQIKDDDQVASIRSNIFAFCGIDKDCKQILNRALDSIRVVSLGSYYFSNPLAYEFILINPTASQALAKLALKMRQPPADSDNFFDDAVKSFRDAGFDADGATNMAWNLMGVYGSRGASVAGIADFFINIFALTDSMPTWVSLLFTSVTPVLNDVTIDSRASFYSYPPQFKTTCGYGSSYHYWMGAYIAKQLLTEFPKLKTKIFETVHLLGSLYEFGAQVNGRDPNLVYKNGTKAPNVTALRRNILFNDAGAYWAIASAALPENFSFDSALLKMIAGGEDIQLTPKQIDKLKIPEKYLIWKRIVSPDVHVKAWKTRLARELKKKQI